MTRYERELVNALDACGYAVLRCPSSGSSSSRDLPDILACRAMPARSASGISQVLAIEHKSTSAGNAYVKPREVDALVAFADRAGGHAFLGVRFKDQHDGRLHYLVSPDDARRTKSGNYAVGRDEARSLATIVVDAGAGSIEYTSSSWRR